MSEGVDYSYDHPDPGGLSTVGKTFVMRYVGPGSAGKLLTLSEVDSLVAHHLWIVSLVEGAARGALSGRDTGRDHARWGRDHAHTLGAPAHRPLYFAVDWDLLTSELPAVDAYFAGVHDVLPHGEIGIYGGVRAMRWAVQRGWGAWFYQTYAWSDGSWYAGNHVEQYRNGVSLVGGTVDLDRGRKVDFGQWQPGRLPGQTGGSVTEIAVNPTAHAVMTGAWHDNWVAGSDETLAVMLGKVEKQVTAFASKVDFLATTVDGLVADGLHDVDAIVQALAANESFVDDLAGRIAAKISEVHGTITLTGTLEGDPPA
jgi:hypothetical protein